MSAFGCKAVIAISSQRYISCAFLVVVARARHSPQEDTKMELNELLYLDLESLNTVQAGHLAGYFAGL